MGSLDKFYLAGINRRINSDGTVTIHCKQCGRPVMRATMPRIRTVTKCAVCVLTEQGVLGAADLIKPQYLLTDPTMPPIPITAEDPVYVLYPEEAMERKGKPAPSGGVIGTAKAFFRAVSFALGMTDQPVAVSKKTGRRQRTGGLYERDDEEEK